MPRGPRPCPEPGCPHLTIDGDCPLRHATQARRTRQRRTDAMRPTARQRGYDGTHERRFRAQVLLRDPTCPCGAKATHADHHPMTRRQLVAQGLDPNDPRHGRGLCGPCHNRHTATHDGGYGNPTH